MIESNAAAFCLNHFTFWKLFFSVQPQRLLTFACCVSIIHSSEEKRDQRLLIARGCFSSRECVDRVKKNTFGLRFEKDFGFS